MKMMWCTVHVEYSTKVRTSFSKLKIMRIALRYSTKKCGALVNQCISYKKEYINWKISIGPLKKKCPKFYLSNNSTLHVQLVQEIGRSVKFLHIRLHIQIG